MPSTIITAGDVTTSLVYTGGNDNTLTIQTGPSGGKLNALTIDGVGKATLLKTPIFTDAPAFSAYQSTLINLGTNINTQIVCQTKEYDLTTSYNATTGNFTAPVAGIYSIVAAFAIATTVTTMYAKIYKNGALYKEAVSGSAVTQQVTCQASLVAGDVIAFYAQQAAVAQNTVAIATDTYFQAALIRAA